LINSIKLQKNEIYEIIVTFSFQYVPFRLFFRIILNVILIRCLQNEFFTASFLNGRMSDLIDASSYINLLDDIFRHIPIAKNINAQNKFLDLAFTIHEISKTDSNLVLSILTIKSYFEIHELASKLLEHFDSHAFYWEKRIAFETTYGASLALIWDFLEGGPIELFDKERIDPKNKLKLLRDSEKHLLSLVGTTRIIITKIRNSVKSFDLPSSSSLSSSSPSHLEKDHLLTQITSSQYGAIQSLLFYPYNQQKPCINYSMESSIQECTSLCEFAIFLKSNGNKVVESFAARSWYKRWWLRFTLASLTFYYGFKNRFEIVEYFKSSIKSISLFLDEHIVTPLKSMFVDIFLSSPKHVSDAAAYAESTESLKQLLLSFNERQEPFLLKTFPTLTKDVLKKYALDMDMRTVEASFIQQVQYPLYNSVNGSLIEALLIQIAFMKKEVLALMKAMDEILLENKFNLQIMATVPGIVVIYVSSILCSKAFSFFTSNAAEIRESQNENLNFRLTLRKIHLALSINGDNNDIRENDAEIYRGLSAEKVGSLDFSIQLCLKLMNHRSFDERIRLREDLCLLLNPSFSVKERLNVLTRVSLFSMR
jgi:ATP synthase regulation protein NCA2